MLRTFIRMLVTAIICAIIAQFAIVRTMSYHGKKVKYTLEEKGGVWRIKSNGYNSRIEDSADSYDDAVQVAECLIQFQIDGAQLNTVYDESFRAER